jgi:hypothetical protein
MKNAMKPSITFNKNREAIRKIVESGVFRLAKPRVFGSVLRRDNPCGSRQFSFKVDFVPKWATFWTDKEEPHARCHRICPRQN